ncbi:MAG: SH3 domain-containing protein [Proteobacteria bacterium]|nr:SH3 domain-containing protein [Pseudomonadota bacterium]
MFRVGRWSALLVGALLLWWGAMVPAMAATPRMVSAAVQDLSLRNGPGNKYDARWTVMKGYPLKVLAARGKWLQVSDFENDRAWVYRPMTNATPHHVVKAKVANLRRAPTTKSALVTRMEYGDVLRTLSRRGDWVQVRTTSGRTGWVSSRLVWGW